MRLLVILSPTDKWGTKADYQEKTVGINCHIVI